MGGLFSIYGQAKGPSGSPEALKTGTGKTGLRKEKSTYPAVKEEELLLFDNTSEPRTESTGAAGEAERPVPSAVGLGDFIRVAAVLTSLVLAVYFLMRILKKLSPLSEEGEDLINVISTRYIQRDRALHLVEVGNQVFLIGCGASSVNLISEITDKESLDRVKLEKSDLSSVSPPSFRKLLGRRKKNSGTSFSITEHSAAFLRAQRERLKKMGGMK